MEAASSIMDAGTRGCLSHEGNTKRNYNTSGSPGHWDCRASALVPDHDGSAEKIQEMLSRAINDQQQLWKILVSASSSSSDQLAASSSDQLGESVDGEQPDQAGIEVAAVDTRRRQQQQLVGITCTPEFNLPARLFRPLAAKLENSLDWCYLALCRIQDLTSQLVAARELPRSMSALPIVNQQVSSVRPCCTGYSILEHEEFHDQQLRPSFQVRLHPNAVSKLKLHGSSLSPLQIPGRTVDSSSLVDEASLPRTPTSLCLLNKARKTESISLAAAPSDCAGDEAGRVDESRIMLASDLEPTQGQNFDHGRLSAALGVMDHPADWPDLQADSDMAIAASTDSKEPQQLMVPRPQISSSKAVLLRNSSSNHLKMGQDAHDHLISPQNNQGTIRRTDSLDGRSITSTSTIRCNPTREEKRDKEAVIDAEEDGNTSVVVVYQRLRPGVDRSLKGIPPDGHRRWKKYGNKTIQNANFSRGYYKCSVKECNAKKMVQKTDKDPSVFEVTYTGTHTCNYNPQYNKKQKTGNSLNVQAPAAATNAATAHDVPAARKVLDHESPKHTTSDNHQAAAQLAAAAPVCSQELEQDQTSPAAAASHEDRNNRYYASTNDPSIALDVCSAPSTEEDQAVVKEKELHHQQETANSSATAAASAACWSEFARFEHAADQQFMSSSDLEAAISTESSSLDQVGRIKSDWKKFALDQQQLDYAETVDMDSLYMLNLQDSAMSSWPELLPDN